MSSPTTKIFLHNIPIDKLPRSVNQIKTNIRQFLHPFKVKDIKMIQNPRYNKKQGVSLQQRKFMHYCIATMDSQEEATKLLKSDKNQSKWMDATVKLEYCRPKDEPTQQKKKSKKKPIQILDEDKSPTPIADIGANLTSRRFKNDLMDCIQRAKDCNVTHLFITGTSLRESKRALEFVHSWRDGDKIDGVSLYCTAGIHPHDAKSYSEKSFQELRKLIEENRNEGGVVAVGETGLDYNRMFSSKEQQIESFEAHIQLAIELQMPMFLHERDAHEDFIRILSKYKGQLPPVCVHCFTGSAETMKRYVQEGFYIGLTGFINLSHRAQHLYDHLSEIPLNRLMVETDAPFMLPFEKGDPRRNAFNTRCEPFMVYHVIRKIAELRGEDPEELAVATFKNTCNFFRVKER